ncbi:putative ribonuclease H-like domain-containing protein [Tanacetum coccineum]
MIKNKARLVAQGYTQEEVVDYDEVFAPVARIKAIRLFLAYALFMGFMVYQMDVKSTFLYGRIKEEVYVCEPLGFEDPDHPNKVYKVVKALYGLHQAPRAWYETLAKYLLGNGFHRGKIDQTLFIKRQKGDILLVQIYVDDIIFGSTKKEVTSEAERRWNIYQQDKFVAEVLRKFNFSDVKSASTPVDTKKTLVKYADGDDVDVHLYRSMIGSLMYLTVSRPDIIDTPFKLVAYTDSDYAGASLDRKSTTGGYQFLGSRLISWQCKKQTMVATSTTKAEYVAATSCCGQVKQSSMVGFGFPCDEYLSCIDMNLELLSGQKKETKAMVFYQMDTKEVSDRFMAPCFVNGLEAYDEEINLRVEENKTSNEYAVKLCLKNKVKRGNKVVKKELIVALRAITDFGAGTVTIYPEIDPVLEDIEEEEKSLDDWDYLLDFNLDDVPLLGEEELSPFVCKMGQSSHNKKRAMKNLNFFYQDIGTSSSGGGHLTQEEAAKEALAIRMS